MPTKPKYVFRDLCPSDESPDESDSFHFQQNIERSHTSGTNYPSSSTHSELQLLLPPEKQSDAEPTGSYCNGSSPILEFPLPGKIPAPRLSSETRSRTTSFAVTPIRNKLSASRLKRLSSSSSGCRTGRSGAGRSTDATCLTTDCSVIVAIVEGRGNANGEVGIASLDLKSPVLVLSQFADNPTYTKLITKVLILDPVEIILPNTLYDGEKKTASTLSKCLMEQFPDVRLNSIQRRYFNEGQGVQYIKQLCAQEYISVEVDINKKYYSLAATAALLKYIEFIQNITFTPKSLKVVYRGSESTMMIDAKTAKNLEIVRNSLHPFSKQSLFGVMNFTKTPGGSRLLRANLLQPPGDVAVVQGRLDCVTELLHEEELFMSLQMILGRFLDTEHLLSCCVQIPKAVSVKVAEQKINNVLYLKHTLEMAEALKTVTKDFKHPLLVSYNKKLENPQFGEILEMIRDVVHEDARYVKGTYNVKNQKCYAVKPNKHALLDIARKIYNETEEDIVEMVRQLAESEGMPTMRANYTVSRGFHVHLPVPYKVDPKSIKLPHTFLKVTYSKNSIYFTTDGLIKMNCRAKESMEEIYILTGNVLSELLLGICTKVHCLHNLAECVSNLDMLLSFTQAASVGNYVKPEFTDTIAIKNGRHPILAKIESQLPVPNDTYLSEDHNTLIITGPNMSGKSTYLRQVALLQVIAQVGSYVPAEYASFRLCDHIFTRIGNNDDIESNASTFMIEMRESNYILRNVTSRSLITIDELGRGTSAEEGAGICYTICELLQSLKAFTIVATHFKNVCFLDVNYPNVSNFHLQVYHMGSPSLDSDWITSNYHFSHVLASGSTAEQHYGIKIAHALSLPEEVLEESKKMAKEIDEEKRGRRTLSKEVQTQRLKFTMAATVKQLFRNGKMNEYDLMLHVTEIQRHYVGSLREIEKDFSSVEVVEA